MLLLWLLFAASEAQELLSNPRCNLPLDRGSCNHFTVQWYYDRYDHRCRRFHYGGCEGNENRFNTLEECSAACHFEPTSNRERCFQPHDPGECNNDFERWFFDANKKQCVCSWWTGCGGNSNLFYSYPHCMYYCGEFAEHGPGMDENYWARRNKSIHPHASLAEVALAGSGFRLPQRSQQRLHDRTERSFSDWSLQDKERENYGLEQQLPDQKSQNYEQALRRTREEDSSESYLQSSMDGHQGDYQQSTSGDGEQRSRYQPSSGIGQQHSGYQAPTNGDQRAHYQQGASEQQPSAYRHAASTNGDQRARYQQAEGQYSSSYAFADKQQASYPQSVVSGQPSGGSRGGGYQHSTSATGDQRARYQQADGQRSSTYAFADKQQASYPQSVVTGQPSGTGGGGYQHAASSNGDQRARYQQADGQRSSTYAFADKQQASYPQSVVSGQPSGSRGGGYQHAAPSNGDQRARYQQAGQRSSTYAFADKQQASYPQSVVNGQPSGTGGGGYQHAASSNGDQRARYQQAGQRSSTYAFADKQQASYPQSVVNGQPSGTGGGGYQHAASWNGDQQTQYRQSMSSNGEHRTQYQQSTSPNSRTTMVTSSGPGYTDQRMEQQQWSQNVQPSSRYSEFRSSSSHTYAAQSHFHSTSVQGGYPQQSNGWYSQSPRARGDRIYRFDSGPVIRRHANGSTTIKRQTVLIAQHRQPRMRFVQQLPGLVELTHISSPGFQTMAPPLRKKLRKLKKKKIPPRVISPQQNTQNQFTSSFKTEPVPIEISRTEQGINPTRNRSQISRERTNTGEQDLQNVENLRIRPQQDSPSKRQEKKKHNNFLKKESNAPTLPPIVLPPATQLALSLAPTPPPIPLPPATQLALSLAPTPPPIPLPTATQPALSLVPTLPPIVFPPATQPTLSLAPTLPPIVLPPATQPTLSSTSTLPPIVLPPATQQTLSVTLPLTSTPSITATTPETPSRPPTPRQAKVRDMVIDAGVLFETSPTPTTRVEAEPIELIRPVVTSVPAKKVIFDEILATDAEYYDEYEEPMDEPANSKESNTEILTTKTFGTTTTPASAVSSPKSTIAPIVVPPQNIILNRIDDQNANLIPEKRRKGAENQLLNLVPPTSFEDKQAVPAQLTEWTPIVFPVDHQTSTTQSTATEDYPENVEFDIQTVGIEG